MAEIKVLRLNTDLRTEIDALKAQAELDCATIDCLRCSLQALDLELLALINTPSFLSDLFMESLGMAGTRWFF